MVSGVSKVHFEPSALMICAPLDQGKAKEFCRSWSGVVAIRMPHLAPPAVWVPLASFLRSSQVFGGPSKPAFSARSVR